MYITKKHLPRRTVSPDVYAPSIGGALYVFALPNR
jgi:hypothetical protein